MFAPYLRACPPGFVAVIVQPGDTLYHLALHYGTTVEAILMTNPGIDPYRLRVGHQLCIPIRKTPPCPEHNYYSVRPGDTLYAIARYFNISLYDLMEANPGINPNNLMVGQVLCIPLATPPVTCPPDSAVYTVKAGDTFYRIALRFNVKVESLMAANPRINPRALLIGQRICIPPQLAALPETKEIVVFVEGQQEKRLARLARSDLGYYIYVLPQFTFSAEEPGKDILFSNVDDRFFVRIEPLPTEDIAALRESAYTELRQIGQPRELSGNEIGDPFFRKAVFFLQASDAQFTKNIIVMRIDHKLFRFTMNIPNTEASEGIVSSMFAMLKTIGTEL